jgi:small-conductance mechanosensitive channel
MAARTTKLRYKMSQTVKRGLLSFLLLGMLIHLAGCASQRSPDGTAQALAPTATPAISQEITQTPATSDADSPMMSDLATLVEVAPSRTPRPTATPDALSMAVDEVAQQTGLAGTTILGLNIEDWFSMAASLLLVLAAYLVGTWAIRWLFPRLTARTKTDLDDQLMGVAGNAVRWLIVVLILRFATERLDFIGPRLQTPLADVYFLLALGLSILIVWRLIDLIAKILDGKAQKANNQKEAESLITLVVWGLRLILLIIALSIFLNQFGFNVTGFAVFLAIMTLTISLAGRDVLADVIAGAFILLDQPYRIGDRVGLEGLDTWGNVAEIGSRYTKILTIDNRMVIMPNSQMGQNQIVNYSYPDPSYYVQVNLGIAYENDLDQVEKLVKEAIHSVDGVMNDRAVGTFLTGFEETQIVILLGWWIDSYTDLYAIRDQVSRAIVKKLKEAGVIFPYRRYTSSFGITSDEKVSD